MMMMVTVSLILLTIVQLILAGLVVQRPTMTPMVAKIQVKISMMIMMEYTML